MTTRKKMRANNRRRAFVVPVRKLPSHQRSFELIKEMSAVVDESAPKEVFIDN